MFRPTDSARAQVRRQQALTLCRIGRLDAADAMAHEGLRYAEHGIFLDLSHRSQ